MRLALITGAAARHTYLAARIQARFDLVFALREERGLRAHYAGHPDQAVFDDHFDRFAEAESAAFGDAVVTLPADRLLTVPKDGLNAPDVARRLRDAAPDAVVVFGCGIIRPPLLEALPAGRAYNLHQGLSPYYRGGASNFWPFVFGEFHCIGATVHEVDAGIDTGGIIAHVRPDIVADDTQPVLGCKTIAASVDLLVHVLSRVDRGTPPAAIPQWAAGRLFRRADLTADAVRLVRQREANGDVAAFLDRRRRGEVPPLQLVRLES